MRILFIFAVAAFTVVASRVVADPVSTVEGLGLVMLGIPVNFLRARKGPATKAMS